MSKPSKWVHRAWHPYLGPSAYSGTKHEYVLRLWGSYEEFIRLAETRLAQNSLNYIKLA